jgi:hypothetical protein
MKTKEVIIEPTSTTQDSQVQQLKAILYLLQEHLERFKEEVGTSYELFEKIGKKTKLAEQIEGYLNNPLESIMQSSNSIEQQVKDLISKVVQGFFKSKAELLSSVHLTKNENNALYYSIVLKKDNLENRTSLFEFFEWYNKLDVNIRYPIYFQFVPVELIGKIKTISAINIQRVGKSPHSSGGA